MIRIDSPEVLKDVSFEITPGERVGIGKSFLSMLVSILI